MQRARDWQSQLVGLAGGQYRAAANGKRPARPTIQEQTMTEKDVDNMIRANERRILREKLICAALTGLMRQTSASEWWYAERAIAQADAIIAALDKEAAE